MSRASLGNDRHSLQVVMCEEGTGTQVGWVDSPGWVQRSWLASIDEARSLPLPATNLVFLAPMGQQ